jgi:hypothetical protein
VSPSAVDLFAYPLRWVNGAPDSAREAPGCPESPRQDPPAGAARGPTRSSACRTRTRRVRRPCAPRRPGPRQARTSEPVRSIQGRSSSTSRRRRSSSVASASRRPNSGERPPSAEGGRLGWAGTVGLSGGIAGFGDRRRGWSSHVWSLDLRSFRVVAGRLCGQSEWCLNRLEIDIWATGFGPFRAFRVSLRNSLCSWNRSGVGTDNTTCRFAGIFTGATGLEPATSGVTGRRSNQLNYAPQGDGQCSRVAQ